MESWDNYTVNSIMKLSSEIEKACVFGDKAGLLFNTKDMENVSVFVFPFY